jgi:hypothetical protein
MNRSEPPPGRGSGPATVGETVAGLSDARPGIRALLPAIILALLLAGCARDEPRVPSEEGRDHLTPTDLAVFTRDSQGALDRVEERLKDSAYPLVPIANPDPNQYGANGGRALRCDLVGVDLLFWVFDDEESARRAGERWEGEVATPMRWTLSKNLLLLAFADDDFAGVSADAAEELFGIFTGGGS